MSSQKKIIAVIGSTGAQGGSVARALLRDGTFAVRAITRDPSSSAAQQLRAAGAQVVKADADNVDTLRKAFRGAYGVFSVTDFWGLYFGAHAQNAPRASEHEAQHGKNIVDAAEAEGIRHLIWSTLESSRPFGLHAYHFESKVEVNEYLKHKRIPTTYLYTSCYFSNLDMRGWLKEDNGSFMVDMVVPSDVTFPFYDSAETGTWVLTALKNPQEWIGKDMHAVSSLCTPRELVRALRRTGKKITLNEVSREKFESRKYRNEQEPMVWDIGKLAVNGGFLRDIALSKRGNPNPTDIHRYIATDPGMLSFLGKS